MSYDQNAADLLKERDEWKAKAERYQKAAIAAGQDVKFALAHLSANGPSLRIVCDENGIPDMEKSRPWWVSFAETLKEHFGLEYDLDILEIRKTLPRAKWKKAEADLKKERASEKKGAVS